MRYTRTDQNKRPKAHYLKRNADSELPTHVLCFDTEASITDVIEQGEKVGEQHRLRLGTAIYLRRRGKEWSEKEYTYRSVDEFWKILDELSYAGSTLYLIAHNTAYDHGIVDMDGYFETRGLTVYKFVINSVFMVDAGNQLQRKSIKLIDTTNWFKQPLERLGRMFGYEKGHIEDFRNVSDDVLLPYCKQDTRIIAEVFKYYINFISDNDLGNFAPTAAGQAFNAFRHRFMSEDILIHANDELYEMEMKSYRGGRTDIFRQGEFHDIIKLDINSMYPYVMKENEYPTKPVSKGIIEGVDIPEVLEHCKKYFVVGEFDISINAPCLAVKREKLIFPVGRIRAVLTSPEIMTVLENGELLECHGLVLYEKAKLFEEYVNHFYKLKVEAKDNSLRELSKLFLNSLYGKFGQRQLGEITDVTSNTLYWSVLESLPIEDNVIYYHDAQESYKVVRMGNKLYKITGAKQVPGNNSSPIISSAVTAYARCYLWSMMDIAGLEHVYYCDTDSLFVDRTGYELLDKAGFIDSKEIGKLKVEGIGSCVLRGPKDYDWYEGGMEKGKMKQTIKGVPRSSKKLDDSTYEYMQWETGVRRYHKGEHGTINLERATKTLSRNYDKGTIENGFVHPFVLNELVDGEFHIPKCVPDQGMVFGERPSSSWTLARKSQANYVSNIIGVSTLSADRLISKLRNVGIAYDQFPWDELSGGDLSYQEVLGRMEAMLGRTLSGGDFTTRDIMSYDEDELLAMSAEMLGDIKREHNL